MCSKGAKKTPATWLLMNCSHRPCGVLDADVLLRAVAGAAPEQAVAVDAREPGELAADDLEDLRRPQARDEEPELAMDLGRDLARTKLPEPTRRSTSP